MSQAQSVAVPSEGLLVQAVFGPDPEGRNVGIVAQLRAGWQAVADFVEEAAQKECRDVAGSARS